MQSAAKLLSTAYHLLSLRAHSIKEMQRKLQRREKDQQLIDEVITQLIQDNLLDDAQFARDYSMSRVEAGYGPNYIAQCLLQKGISKALSIATLHALSIDWRERIAQVHKKKFSLSVPKYSLMYRKQIRFFLQRGFIFSDIEKVLKELASAHST